MPGAGTSMANTNDRTASVCLDLTRLISRVGRGQMTGIDRVELAYLKTLVHRCPFFFGLVRARRTYFLLDRTGAEQLLARLQGRQPWGPRDLRSRLLRRHPALRQAVWAGFLLSQRWPFQYRRADVCGGEGGADVAPAGVAA